MITTGPIRHFSESKLASNTDFHFLPSTNNTSHLLVSQNRHEVYLTFATYDEAYLRYLNGPSHPNDPTSFLEMHEYGPWDTYNSSHMNKLGRILLAYTMRASDEQSPGAQGSQPKKQNQGEEQGAEQYAPSGQQAVRPKRAAGLFGNTAK